MTYWAIVPIKPLLRSKSRLASVLSKDERQELSQDMLINTLEVLNQVSSVETTLVVSRDSRALALARKHGARTVTEYGSPELNQALVRATYVAQQYGVAGVLVLPADLPLLDRGEVELLIGGAGEPPVVVIAPDRRGSGTNALLVAPPGLIEYDFGPDSFSRHQKRAKQAGAKVVVCEMPSLELDLDSLAVMDVIMELEDSMDISIPLNLIPDIKTVGDLAGTIGQLKEET